MNKREHAGAHHGEERHRFSRAVDRGTPALLQEQENGRDQRAGVTDTDPPNEINDRKSPAHRLRHAPEQVAEGEHQDVDDAEGEQHSTDPAQGRASGKDGPHDLFRHGSKRVPRRDHRRIGEIRPL